MKYSAFLLIIFLASGCAVRKTEKVSWQHLFNGKDLSNWSIKIRGHKLGDNFKNTFLVKDGLLTVDYSQYKTFDETYGHIFYNKPFADYFLEAEYRFVGDQCPGGPGWAYRNNGLMLHCQDPKTMELDQDYPISIECQLLGGNGKDPRTTCNVCTPGTNIDINGKLETKHCISSTSKTYAGDQWVRAQVLVLGDSLIRQYVNGELVLEYTKPQIGGENVHNFDPAVKKDGSPLSQGFISLQSESHPTQFKRVDLVDLSKYRNDPKTLDAMVARLLKSSLSAN